MKKTLSLMALVAALAAPMAAQAHRAWIQPSATVLSGNDAWVGFDAAMSNGVFAADHAAMRLDGLVITGPDGNRVEPANMMRGQYRATFDAHLTAPGTYRVANLTSGMNVSYTLNGETQRWRGQAADMAAAIPAGATDVTATRNANRIETWVTLGAPTETVFQPTGEGIEVVPVTHPNDLVAGEPATFRLMKDGQAAAGMEVTVARGGLRYRDAAEEMTVTTGADGGFTVTYPEAGMYWMNAASRTAAQGDQPATSAQWSATVEVLP